MKLLDIENLTISYQTDSGLFPAVNQVSFSINQGQSLGLIGESGCGKTTIGMGILRLLPENSLVTGGRINFRDINLLDLPETAMQTIRGGKIAMIFQAAMNSLNPVLRVGNQITEAIQAHDKTISNADAMKKAAYLFQEVGIPEKRLLDFPHQFSGGMKQRAVIAMALSCDPDLIIADEPTTALDMLVQSRILRKIREIQQHRHLSILLISHDIGVVSDVCQDIGVMYRGVLVEQGDRESVLSSPIHPYTKTLMNAYLTLDTPASCLTRFPPTLPVCPTDTEVDTGCCFASACPDRKPVCITTPPPLQVHSTTHCARCHFYRY